MANDAMQNILTSTLSSMKSEGVVLEAVAAGHGHPEFYRLLDEMRAMHERKAMDYGDPATGDPFANIRRSAAAVGVSAWRAAFLRALDKVHRISEFAKRGTLANEGVEDSLLDLAAYALIALVMLREESAKQPPPATSP